jgi:hypothetical protein
MSLQLFSIDVAVPVIESRVEKLMKSEIFTEKCDRDGIIITLE